LQKRIFDKISKCHVFFSYNTIRTLFSLTVFQLVSPKEERRTLTQDYANWKHKVASSYEKEREREREKYNSTTYFDPSIRMWRGSFSRRDALEIHITRCTLIFLFPRSFLFSFHSFFPHTYSKYWRIEN